MDLVDSDQIIHSRCEVGSRADDDMDEMRSSVLG